MSSITERVAAGAAFLDEHDPEWWRADAGRAIDLDELDLGDGMQCVLGQRCPLEALAGQPRYATRYMANAQRLSGIMVSLDDEGGTDALDDWAAERGFQLATDWPALGHSFTALTGEWKRVITERRSRS